eukprot:244186_1
MAEQQDKSEVIALLDALIECFQINNDILTIQELLRDGLTYDEAKTIIQASYDRNVSAKCVYQCICGQNLIQADDVKSVYSSERWYCDFCGIYAKPNDTMWHCGKNRQHPKGFDICHKCIDSYDPQLFDDTNVKIISFSFKSQIQHLLSTLWESTQCMKA